MNKEKQKTNYCIITWETYNELKSKLPFSDQIEMVNKRCHLPVHMEDEIKHILPPK